MGKGFEYKACDRAFYDKHLKDFLPDKMFDAHVHISTAGLSRYGSHNGGSTWTDYLCKEMGVEEFLAMNKEMFPNQKMEALIFGMCLTGINETNAYVINNNKDYGFPMLYRSDYAQSPDELEANVKAGGFIGLKPYLSNCPSYIPSNEVRIFDFLPPAQLEVANKNGWIIMLHIPRNKRLGDPVNIAQIMEIEEKYPNVKFCGLVPQKELPAKIKEFDVCLNVFREGRLSKDVSPLKFYEYLATGKPVVSTREPLQVADFADVVHVASGLDDFLVKCEEALRESDPIKREKAEKRMEYGRQCSWDERVKQMETILKDKGIFK
jgi:hypothetical protein